MGSRIQFACSPRPGRRGQWRSLCCSDRIWVRDGDRLRTPRWDTGYSSFNWDDSGPAPLSLRGSSEVAALDADASAALRQVMDPEPLSAGGRGQPVPQSTRPRHQVHDGQSCRSFSVWSTDPPIDHRSRRCQQSRTRSRHHPTRATAAPHRRNQPQPSRCGAESPSSLQRSH